MTIRKDNLKIAIHFLILIGQAYSSQEILMQPAKLVFEGDIKNAEASCHNKTVVCELKFPNGNWDEEEGDENSDTFRISDIDVTLCTHLLYKFVEVNPDSLTVQVNEVEATEETRNFYQQLAALGKGSRSSLKLLLSVGGGGNETLSKAPYSFARIGASKTKRKAFISSVLIILKEYQFHGVDVEWNQPGVPAEMAVIKGDKYLRLLMKDLRKFLKPQYELTISVSGNQNVLLPSKTLKYLSRLVDHFHLEAHDLSLYERKMTSHHSALKADDDRDVDWTSIEEVIEYYKNHTDPAKLVMKIATHGKSFQLRKRPRRGQNGLGDRTDGSDAVEVGFREICRNLTTQTGWTTYFDESCRVPFARRGSRWVSFDDLNSTEEKVDFAIRQGLKGIMVTSIRNDDFDGKACRDSEGDLRKYPLLRTINHRIAKVMGSKCGALGGQEPLGLLLGFGIMSFLFCSVTVVVVILKNQRHEKRKVLSTTGLPGGNRLGGRGTSTQSEILDKQYTKGKF